MMQPPPENENRQGHTAAANHRMARYERAKEQPCCVQYSSAMHKHFPVFWIAEAVAAGVEWNPDVATCIAGMTPRGQVSLLFRCLLEAHNFRRTPEERSSYERAAADIAYGLDKNR